MRNALQLFFCFGVALALIGCGEEKPDKEEIKRTLVQAVPGYYSVDDVSIVAQANEGSKVEPVYKSRFNVTLSPREPLYDRADPIEGVAMVQVVRKPGDGVTLYGLASSTHRGESWSTALQFEQALPPGAPISAFGNGVHVLGSQEARDAVAKIVLARQAQEDAARQKILAIKNGLTGTWKGQYVCGQGEAAAEVVISDVSDTGNVRGTFHFFPIQGRKNVADGEFAVIGSVNPDLAVLNIQPGGWIRQPQGYFPIGFQAPYTPSATAMDGRLTNAPGCTTITLRKAG